MTKKTEGEGAFMHPGTELGQYLLGERQGESLQATVFKAYHKADLHTPRILKVLKFVSGSDEQTRYLRQKIERLRVLHDPRACIPLSMESEDGVSFIVHPWVSGVTLDQWAKPGEPCDLNAFFQVACALADTLQAVHDAGIVHGGVKPHNILIQPGTLSLWLTDFITPLDIRDVSHFIYDASFVRDTLAYTSPEQTGRINHRVDFSTDLYSLGIVFYELLTGQLPFFSIDPLELIHSHLAEEAPLASQINPAVPQVLAEIIAKLTLKEPEKRYQSSSGLLADLNRCKEEYATYGRITKFRPGLHDRTRRVVFISRMVGRVQEARQILAEYDQVTHGEFRSLFISGLSGIGKTRLIQELQKPLVKHRGYFTSGKFDQYQKNIPYSSLIQALRHLMRTFLTESDKQVVQWQQHILHAVGANGRVVTEVVPELEFIIGKQPEVPHLPPVEARNRFNNTLGQFLSCLASERNPLILFIDDLQWCDVATFDFLQYVFASTEDYPYLYFMGAYRHNEVDASHPLTRLLRGIKDKNGPLSEIRITELDQANSHEMVAYILDATLQDTAALAAFIAELTEGNPLFVSESLAYLYNENLLYMDENHHWRWDMVRIRDSQMPATVVELFSSKVRKLPKETLQILEHCACMGNRFTPQDLSLILGLSLPVLFGYLKPVLSLGMLLENKTDLQFVHDRVQEAVLREINPRRRKAIHWRVGIQLLDRIPINQALEQRDNLFTIAAHLNRGLSGKADQETRWMLALINFYAGNKALDALATEAANEFFRAAHALLPKDCWQQDYQNSFRIFQSYAKTELMGGRYEESERLINELVSNAANDLDKAEALAEQTTSLSSVGNFIKAIATANRGLEYFGKAIPADEKMARKRMQVLMEEISVQGDVWSKILNMPFTEERHSKIELAFYSELIPDLYMSGMVPQLYLSAAQSTQNCLQGGMDESVIYSFSIMGLNLGEQGQFDLAFKYQDLAQHLCERYPNTFGATRGMNGIVWCNMHSRSHPAEIVDYCRKSIQSGKNCGDLYNAGLSYGPLMWNLQVQGKNMKDVEEAALECLQFSRKNQLSFSVGMAEAVMSGWVQAMKSGSAAFEPMDERLAHWERDNHVASAGSYFVLRGIAEYFLQAHEQASSSLENVTRYLSGLTDNVLKRQWMVFRMLNRLRLSNLGHVKQSPDVLLSAMAPQIEQVRAWSQLGPLLKPFYALLQAEMALVRGDRREARNLYLDCSELAHGLGYVMLEGFVHQCLGQLKEKTGMGNPGMHFREALRLYEKSHARSLADLLTIQHAAHVRPDSSRAAGEPMAEEVTTLPDLDLDYLMKSALAISAEIDLQQLLKKVMSVVLESSGAQHGYLLIKEGETLSILAENHVAMHEEGVNPAKGSSLITQQRAVEEGRDISLAIVNFVFRTREKVILSNAMEHGPFTEAAEVQQMQMRSLLCLPILKQGLIVGVLYLENRLAEGVFTPGKIGMTEMLAAQAAISMENARLLHETRNAEEVVRKLNETLEQRVAEALDKNREKDLLMIQQSRLAAMGEMIGNIAHQWRQPLNALALVLSNIKDAYHFQELTPEYLAKATADGTRLIQKMSTTINDFQNFFKQDKHEQAFSARAQVEEALALVDASFSNSKIDIRLEAPGDVQLSGFPNEYSQVLLNVLNNAKDAIQAHGVKGRVIIRLHSEHGMGCLTVEDNGGGVPDVVKDKIFEPYFSTKPMGTGIGLYMSKMIVERNMHGYLDFKNLADGAAFTIATPLAGGG